MSAILRLGAMLLGLMLAFAWPGALAQGRQGQGHGGQAHHGGQHYGGPNHGGQYHGGRRNDARLYGGPPHWRGDFGRFDGNDRRAWRGGHWHHGYHGGSLGWWWIVGPAWYYYPQPVYPYPGPWAAPAQYWYYCPSSRIYYPYVPMCPGWQQVPVVPDEGVLVPIPQVP